MGFSPGMVLWGFLKILSLFNTFITHFVIKFVAEIKLNIIM